MDDTWRFRPPPPPPPPFDDPHRFRPPYPQAPYPNPAFRGPDPWAAIPHPPLERPPVFHPPHPSLMFFDDDREAYRKRMRVDDSSHQHYPFQTSFSSEDERRLNLIRDHGNQGFPPFDRGFPPPVHGFPERNRPPLPPEHDFAARLPNSQRFGGFVLPEGERRDPYAWDRPNQSYRHDNLVGVSGAHEIRPFEQRFRNDPRLQDSRQPHPKENSYISPKHTPYSQMNGYRAEFSAVNAERESSNPPSGLQNSERSKFEYHSQHGEMIRNHHKHSDSGNVQQPHQHQSYSGRQIINEESSFTRMPGTVENGVIATTMVNHSRTPQKHAPLPSSLMVVRHELSPPNYQGTPSLPSATVPSPAMAGSTTNVSLPSSARTFSETHPSSQADLYGELPLRMSSTFATKALPFLHQAPSTHYPDEGPMVYPSKQLIQEKPTVIDACHLFRQPHRVSRPDHFVIILRGLPGSGKSYLAKTLRDIEVDHGGSAPRIHAIDDYFMIEVEKFEDNGGSRSSTSVRGKKQNTKKVIEYCYEPEMEEAYRSSMLKAFKKTLDEGIFTFIIVDDRNLRVADFAQFWAIAKRSGYEVYLLEATYKDPTGCAARNVHGFTLDDIKKMADQWEEAPPLYLQLDIQSLIHGDDLNEHSIQEVDMDMDDASQDLDAARELNDKEDIKIPEPTPSDNAPDGLVNVRESWDAGEDDEEPTTVKELEKSKWSKDMYEDLEDSDSPKEKLNALSGLLQAYGKGDKSVRWGDQVKESGFSISAVKRRVSSLVIGPGSGYNLDSNPLQDEDSPEAAGRNSGSELKKRFHDQLRAERDSFKAVFDKRKQRIGGFHDSEDD
ncbi:hypothetical protein J5N97_006419 [Dioscorea zingiberensis]|uniref:YLP motif-containing protein 1 n=1 Tax=Dioscorea zingiberensis TaxID=325984 RepID=A0A9D5DA48_9LILI|nr:hypothetical protein J5N97_006419 [Dioscorea zingiberensis]